MIFILFYFSIKLLSRIQYKKCIRLNTNTNVHEKVFNTLLGNVLRIKNIYLNNYIDLKSC